MCWEFVKRWRRFAIPLALVLAVTVVTLVCHALQSDDVSDPNFLSPTSSAPDGAATLAGQLRQHGVTLSTGYGANDVLTQAEAGDVTLFIPEPSLLNAHQQDFLNALPPSDTIVLVAPDGDAIDAIGLQLAPARTHWSTRVAEPDCPNPMANRAGPAGIDGREYQGGDDTCYHGALVSTEEGEFWLAGASDVFRNDRAGQAGNQALAVSLLSRHQRLLWIDIHRQEAPPRVVHTDQYGTAQRPDVVYVRDNGDGPSGDNGQNSSDDGGDGGSHHSSQAQSGGSNASGDGSGGAGMAALFPGWMWTVIGLIALAAVAIALAAARRLGPPVTEPMPVTARLRESVEGRGRLYRRAQQPERALNVMRATAIDTLPDRLGVPAATPMARLLELAAERSGWPRDVISGLLRDDQPESNAHMLALVQRLDQLMAVLSQPADTNATRRDGPDLT